MHGALLALIIASPFLLLVLIGIWFPILRNLRTPQQRDQDFERDMAEKRRRIRGRH